MKLRSMSATVEEMKNVVVEVDENGEVVLEHFKNAIVLKSYKSVVAIYANEKLFLFPRYRYSVTTIKHLKAFIEDYIPYMEFKSINDITKALREHRYDMHLATGYDYNLEMVPEWQDEAGRPHYGFVFANTNIKTEFKAYRY